MIVSVDWIHALAVYVVVSILVLLCVSLRMRSAAQIRAVTWFPFLLLLMVPLVAHVGIIIPGIPPSQVLTGFTCLWVGMMLGTGFDPLKPVLALGTGTVEQYERNRTDKSFGRRRPELEGWLGLLISLSLFFIACLGIDFT